MFNSKFFMVMALLTLLAVGAVVTFQVLEIQEYQLFDVILKRFGIS